MIIDTDKTVFVYVKNTRVCGTTLVRYARSQNPMGLPNLLIPQNHPNFEETKRIFHDYFMLHEIGKDMQYISVCRNPYTHTVSYWYFTNRWFKHNMSFKDSLLYIPNGKSNIVGLQQHIFTHDHTSQVDHLLRYEDGDVVSRVLDIAGIKHDPADIGHFSPSRYEKNWWEYYDSETIQLVKDLFAKDFEVLGYDTEFPH